ncbi:TIMD4 protein, partial [Serilophus lunatus]|nr:TIMD4 protein [Serilophus lunatus]
HTESKTVVRGVMGQPVKLPCNYKVTQHSDISDMCWGRGPCPNSKCKNTILDTIGSTVRYRKSQRYNLRGSVSSGDVSLTIGMVKAEDAGVYCCRVEIPGWFNDIKQNIHLEVVRARPVMTTTTRKAPVSPKHFKETTFAPQPTSGLQPTAQTTVPKTTTTESPAMTTLETFAPPAIAVTTSDIFPGTEVTTDFPTSSPEVTSEFPNILPTAEGSTSAHTSVMMEDVPTTATSATPSCVNSSEINMHLKPFQLFFSLFQFPSSAVLIACAIGGAIFFLLMVLLFWKCKHVKKFIMKSVGPPEEHEKVFSGAEGENNIFSL